MARDRSTSPGEKKDRRKRKKTRWYAVDSSDPKGDSQTLTTGEKKDRRKRKKTRCAGDSSDPKGDSQTLTTGEKKDRRKKKKTRYAGDSSDPKGDRQTLTTGEKKDRRKKKKTSYAGDSSDPKGDSQTLTPDSTPQDPSPDERKSLGKGKTRRYDSSTAVDDYIVILRGALEFRRMTGLLPKKSIFFALYDSIKDKLHESLSQERVYNKYLFLRFKLSQPPSNWRSPNTDILYELAAKLWPKDEKKIGVKNVRKQEKTQKKNEDVEMEEEEEEQSYPYLVASANDYWKAYGLSNVLLETSLKRLDPLKAKALEAKLKKHFEDEMEIKAESQKIYCDIFALLTSEGDIESYELID